MMKLMTQCQVKDVILSSDVNTPADTCRAAELRAAAAERRLANLAGPSSLVKMDSDPDDKNNLGDTDDDVDVKDPHLGLDERKRDMEADMNEDERRDLRGGWEDYVKVEPGESAPLRIPKRELEEDGGHSRPAKRDSRTPTFGQDLVGRERLKGLGMVQTTLSKTSNAVGSRSQSLADQQEVKPVVNNGSQWECKLCTYINIAGHGRCGEWTIRSSRLETDANQRSVKPVLTALCLMG
jgi:hypothetical protein